MDERKEGTMEKQKKLWAVCKGQLMKKKHGTG